jgi:hypothetical protein
MQLRIESEIPNIHDAKFENIIEHSIINTR